MITDLQRRSCRHCKAPLRTDARREFCSRCQQLKAPCPDCGRPRRLGSRRCRHCNAAKIWGGRLIERTNNGRCRGRWSETYDGRSRLSSPRFVFGAIDGCPVAWGNLDHVHCLCGAPMATRAGLCGECVRRQLEEPFSGYCIRCGLESTLLFCQHCIAETQRELDGAAAAFRTYPPTLGDPPSEYVRASGVAAHVALHRLRF